jgi:hypothetical protein
MINQTVSIEHWDPSTVPIDDIVSLVILLGTEGVRDETTQLNGLTLLFDCKGFNIKMVRYLSPSVVYKAVNVFLVTSDNISINNILENLNMSFILF